MALACFLGSGVYRQRDGCSFYHSEKQLFSKTQRIYSYILLVTGKQMTRGPNAPGMDLFSGKSSLLGSQEFPGDFPGVIGSLN